MANVVKQMLPLADPGFPRQGGGVEGARNPSSGSKNLLFGQMFAGNCAKIVLGLRSANDSDSNFFEEIK